MSEWPEHWVAKLRELAAERMSSGQIAKRIAPHVTRNAVIGQCYRRGIPLLCEPEAVREKRKRAIKPSEVAAFCQPSPPRRFTWELTPPDRPV